MKIVPYINDMQAYLVADDVIDYNNDLISELSDKLWNQSKSKSDYVKITYEYVRDNFPHSADISNDTLTCSASDVIREGHGICFTKSHLLAALLRAKSIPAGLCYQKLILDDETAPVLVYHGLIGVYIEDINKWIRLDPRGNKPGVNAQFSLDKEQLAFPIRIEKGEEDRFTVYPSADEKILEKLRNHTTRSELWDDLPTELAYSK